MLINQFRSAALAEVVPAVGRDYYHMLEWMIMQSTTTIDLTVFQGRVSETNKHHRVRRILTTIESKVIHGVKARMIIYRGSHGDRIGKENKQFADASANRGIEVRFARPGDFVHSKMVIVDQKFVLLGSHNMTVSGIWDNYEASILVESCDIAETYRQYFEWLWERGKKYEEALKNG